MSDVDEVKSRLNIADIVSERVTLKKTGRNLKGLCPFHNEKTPSFIVSPDRQTFHCFGCGKGGSAIDFVMEYEHIDFPEALEQLAEKVGVTLTRQFGDTPERKQKELLYEVNQLAADYYTYILTKHSLGEKALLYLKNRGISDKSIKTFALGYSPLNWDGLYRFLRKKKYEDSVLFQAGLVLKGNHGYYDRFRGRIMFALKDHRGKVLGFSGRVLESNAKDHPSYKAADWQGAKYINTSETPIYIKGNVLYGLDVTKDAVSKKGEAIIMEGEIDVISSFQAGVSNVVAIKGSALTEGHVHLIKRFADRLIFALDSDVAGDAAARRGIQIAEDAGLDMRVITIPHGKDPDEAVRANAVSFKQAIKDAVPIYDYFISSALKRFDRASAFGKRKVSEELLPILHGIGNTIVQAHYIKKVASMLDVGEDAVLAGMKYVQKQSVTRNVAKTEEKQTVAPLSRQEKVEKYLLSLLLQGDTKELYLSLHSSGVTVDVKNKPVRRILEFVQAYVEAGKSWVMKDFVAALPSELVPALDEAYLADITDILDKPERFIAEWERTVRDLKRVILRDKMKQMSAKLQKTDDPSLTREFMQLTAILSELEKSEQN